MEDKEIQGIDTEEVVSYLKSASYLIIRENGMLFLRK